MSLAILTRALVVTKFKVTQGSTERQLAKCNCVHFFRHELFKQYETSIQIHSTFWKISWSIFAPVSLICISSSYGIGNGRTEGLPLANSRRNPVGVRYGDMGAYCNPTPNPPSRKRLVIIVRPRCSMEVWWNFVFLVHLEGVALTNRVTCRDTQFQLLSIL